MNCPHQTIVDGFCKDCGERCTIRDCPHYPQLTRQQCSICLGLTTAPAPAGSVPSVTATATCPHGVVESDGYYCVQCTIGCPHGQDPKTCKRCGLQTLVDELPEFTEATAAIGKEMLELVQALSDCEHNTNSATFRLASDLHGQPALECCANCGARRLSGRSWILPIQVKSAKVLIAKLVSAVEQLEIQAPTVPIK